MEIISYILNIVFLIIILRMAIVYYTMKKVVYEFGYFLKDIQTHINDINEKLKRCGK